MDLSSLLSLAEFNLGEYLSSINSGDRFPLLVVAIGCLTGVVISLAVFLVDLIKSVHSKKLNTQLKQDLLDRGLSPEEVVAIVNAGEPTKNDQE